MIIENETRFRLPDLLDSASDLLSIVVVDNKNETTWDIYFSSKSISSDDYELKHLEEIIKLLQAAYSEINSKTYP